MFQTWANLLFLHWRGDPGLWQRTLPAGLHLDLWEGSAWIGVVPFRMRRIRPAGLCAVPWLSWFLELNVRTYVHDDEGNPGVWFYSLDTNRWPAWLIGRYAFKLPYTLAAMRARDGADGWVDYRCRRRGESDEARFRYRGDPAADAREAAPGTLEHFLLERYLLYSHHPGCGALFTGRVHHAPYRFRPAEVTEDSALPARWNELPKLAGPPIHACVAAAIDVEVFALEPARNR